MTLAHWLLIGLPGPLVFLFLWLRWEREFRETELAAKRPRALPYETPRVDAWWEKELNH